MLSYILPATGSDAREATPGAAFDGRRISSSQTSAAEVFSCAAFRSEVFLSDVFEPGVDCHTPSHQMLRFHPEWHSVGTVLNNSPSLCWRLSSDLRLFRAPCKPLHSSARRLLIGMSITSVMCGHEQRYIPMSTCRPRPRISLQVNNRPAAQCHAKPAHDIVRLTLRVR